MKKKRNAIFLISEKGGVGKSTLAKAILDHLRRIAPQGSDAPDNVFAADLQPKVNQLANCYGIKSERDGRLAYDPSLNDLDVFGGVISASLESEAGINAIGGSLDSQADHMLFDLPGGKSEGLADVFGRLSTFIEEVRGAGYRVVAVIALSYLKTSASEIEEVMRVWGGDVHYVAALNLGLADRSDFIFFDGARANEMGFPAKRIAQAGGIVVEMSPLQHATYAELDADEVPFSRAATDASLYQRVTRVRVTNWLEEMDSEIAKMALIDYSKEDLGRFAAAQARKARK